MNFYYVRTWTGNFWITAKRAAEAYAKAYAILGHQEFVLERDDDLSFVEAS